jgi:hypothetical protein
MVFCFDQIFQYFQINLAHVRYLFLLYKSI